MGTDKCKKQIRHSHRLRSVPIGVIRGEIRFIKRCATTGFLHNYAETEAFFGVFRARKFAQLWPNMGKYGCATMKHCQILKVG